MSRVRMFIVATLTVAACGGTNGKSPEGGRATDGNDDSEVVPDADGGRSFDASAETGAEANVADVPGAVDAGLGGDDRADGAATEAGADAATDVSADAATDALATATLATNRDRLLGTYLAFLRTQPDAQTNGLRGADLASVCDLWSGLDPSSRAVFLLVSARLEGSRLAGGPSALDHVAKLYRVSGGMGASAAGSDTCGGGEYNLVIMSMDATLHAAFIAANAHQGARGASGMYDVTDVPAGGAWRDSHDLGGPHAPFDMSDETVGGAPRGQVQLFADPASALASMPLGRADLSALVDPHALEMNNDFDCTHNANPLCSYVFYGPSCAPEAAELGVNVYVTGYGDFEATWKPAGCP